MCGGKAPQVTDTAEMQMQANLNQTLWNYYQETYKPVISKYIDRTTSPDIQAEESKAVAGRINADTMQKVPRTVSENALDNTIKAAELSNVKTGAQIAGQGELKGRQLGEMENIVSIGSGQETQAQQGLSEIAGASLQTEISDLEREQQLEATKENAIGSAAGGLAGGLFYKAGGTGRKLTYDPTQEVNPKSPDYLKG